MSHCRPEAGDPCIDVSNPVSSGQIPEQQPLFQRISTSFSCPNIKLHSICQQIDSTPSTSALSHAFGQNTLPETKHTPAWRRFSGKVKSGKLTKLPYRFRTAQRTQCTSPGPNCSSMPMGPLHNAQLGSTSWLTSLPPHLAYLVPLGSNGTPRLGEQLAPFTGELNRYNPMWQNLELKEKLADHREARRKPNDFSNGYEALLEEFESLRRSSDSKLTLQESRLNESYTKLESDYLKTVEELVWCKAQENCQRKFTEHWAWLYELEAAKLTSVQRQLESAICKHAPDLVTTGPQCPLNGLTSDASTQTSIEHDSSRTTPKDANTQTVVEDVISDIASNKATAPVPRDDFETLTLTLEDLEANLAEQGKPNDIDEDSLSIVAGSVENIDSEPGINGLPPSSQELELLQMRYSFCSILKDILAGLNRVARYHPENPDEDVQKGG
ncbi:hypothetical protein OIDMADRAFT_145780 [Oidiodendron maius Zn]|uniref:Uncharacterized protein n=1 Tax=Oidiodendron maius (strain Zn) TaxID=913774 RepID=A0A0C3GW30_OIDMZ|nr:hypothetical protein OIDMADRAFT_145780 [Oidiodendron maius Zn]